MGTSATNLRWWWWREPVEFRKDAPRGSAWNVVSERSHRRDEDTIIFRGQHVIVCASDVIDMSSVPVGRIQSNSDMATVSN